MNKALSIFLLSSAFATSLVLAQSSGTPPTPAEIAARRVEFLTNRLGLSTAQQQQATTIFTNSATAAATVRESLRTARQSLSDAVKSNGTAAIDQIATTIGGLDAQQTSIEAKADAAFYQILTADQKTKFDSGVGRGPGGFGGLGRPGARGFGGPGR